MTISDPVGQPQFCLVLVPATNTIMVLERAATTATIQATAAATAGTGLAYSFS